MKITRNQLKELVKRAIYSKISEQETVKFKDPETGKDHEITMDTAQRYKSDIDAGDKSKEKEAAVKAAGLDKDDKGVEKKSEPKQTKISANPFGDGGPADLTDKDDDFGGKAEPTDKDFDKPDPSTDPDYDGEWDDSPEPGYDDEGDIDFDNPPPDPAGEKTKAKAKKVDNALFSFMTKYNPTFSPGMKRDEFDTLQKLKDRVDFASDNDEDLEKATKEVTDYMTRMVKKYPPKSGDEWIKNFNEKQGLNIPLASDDDASDVYDDNTTTTSDGNYIDWSEEAEPEDLLSAYDDIKNAGGLEKQGYLQHGKSDISLGALQNSIDDFESAREEGNDMAIKYIQKKIERLVKLGYKNMQKKNVPTESVIKTKKQLKETIRSIMHNLISEDKKYKAKKKDGKVVYFTDKDNWKNALKSGDYEKVDSKKVKGKPTSKSKLSGDPFGGDDEQMFNVFVDDEDKPMKIKAKDAKSARNKAYQKIQNPNVKVTAEPAGVGGPSHADVPKGANKKMDAALNKDIDKVTGYLNSNNFSPEDLDPIINQLKAAGKDTEELENFKMDIGYDMEDNNWEAVGDQLGYLKDALPSYKADISTGNVKLDNAYKQAQKLKKELKALVGKGDKEGMRKKEVEIKKLWANTIEPLEKKVKPEASKKWSDMLGQESVKESKMRRFTVKEVRMWMKTLEENRYKKVYNSDARRVSWMVNNEGVDLQEMPKSMRKKWTKAQYGRERYLAKEFVKSKKQQMTEQKLRKVIRESIKKIMEGKIVRYEIPTKDKKKVQALVKKLRLKDGKDYSIYGSGKTFEMELDVKHANKVLELLMKMNIKVRG